MHLAIFVIMFLAAVVESWKLTKKYLAPESCIEQESNPRACQEMAYYHPTTTAVTHCTLVASNPSIGALLAGIPSDSAVHMFRRPMGSNGGLHMLSSIYIHPLADSVPDLNKDISRDLVIT
jgi:hypothetical protein